MTDQGSSAGSPRPSERVRFELPPARPSIGLALVAFLIVAAVAIGSLVVKVLVPGIAAAQTGPLVGGGDAPIVLGSLGLFSIAPVVVAIVLAHRVLGPEGEVPRGGRLLAAAVLGAGYLIALWWVTRVIVAATLIVASNNDYYQFLYNFFLWA